MAAPIYYTADMVRALPDDGNRVVGGDGRVVEVWTPKDDFPALEREQLVWHPPGASQPFIVRLEDLFRPV